MTRDILFLLRRKSEAVYADMLEIISQYMSQMNLCIQLRCVTIDFKLSVSNVFDKYLNSTRVQSIYIYRC
jgi:hypothetical protein